MSRLPKAKALFLDRDGVINLEHCYVHRREDFHFQEGIFDLCRAARDLNYVLVVITNQAGIARGLYTESQYLELTEWMIEQFAGQGIQIAHVYHCPYHPIHGVGKYKRESPDRKPNPGMLLRASADYELDLPSSVLIGDQMSDIEAGKAAGIRRTILLGAPNPDIGTIEGCDVSDSLDEIRRRFFSRSNAMGEERAAAGVS